MSIDPVTGLPVPEESLSIDPTTGLPTRDSTPTPVLEPLSPDRHYLHEWIPASVIGEGKAYSDGKATASRYPTEAIDRHLNKRDAEGWVLLSMEPHWWYEQKNISLAVAIARPLAIIGWYLTFVRAHDN